MLDDLARDLAGGTALVTGAARGMGRLHAERALEHIRVGDIYQVQVGHAITVRTQADELTVYRRMRERNPSPYMSLLPIAGRVVVGASPELFLRLEGRTATMRPIAGTARRSAARSGRPVNSCPSTKSVGVPGTCS